MKAEDNNCMLDANLYSIEIYVTPLSEKDYKAIAEKFRYYCKKNGCSWLLVFSSTESDTAKQCVEKTGKRGRPPKKVQGVKTDGHIHSAVKGTEERSAFSPCNSIKQALNKRYKGNISKVVSKGRGIHALNYIGYSLNQADSIRSGGLFDFLEFVKSHSR